MTATLVPVEWPDDERWADIAIAVLLLMMGSIGLLVAWSAWYDW